LIFGSFLAGICTKRRYFALNVQYIICKSRKEADYGDFILKRTYDFS
jgi:hypothetical protein